MQTALILAALMILAQSSRPLPRQAIQGAAPKSNKGQGTATANKASAAEMPAVQNSPQASGSQNASPQQTSPKEEEPQPIRVVGPVSVSKDLLDELYIWAMVLLTLATFAIAIFAIIQARAQINSQRAWLIPTRIIPPGLDPHKYLLQWARDCDPKEASIIVEVTNYGVTPAWITKQFCNSGVLRESGHWNLNYQSGLVVGEVAEKPMEPRGGGEPHKLLAVQQLDDASRAAILRGLFYVYGFVEYRDVFGKQRESHFCWQYSIFTSGIGDIGMWTTAGPRKAKQVHIASAGPP